MTKKPTKGEYLEVLLRSSKTIFSTKEVALLWGETKEKTVSGRLHKYAKSGKLIRVRRGFYAKDAHYNRFELATRIYTPAYVSFETVLTRSAINFQYYEMIFVASYLTREIQVDGRTISFIRMKDYILTNTAGIEHNEGYSVATPERAFLDRIYISKDYHFDNLDSLDWKKIFTLVPIYRTKWMERKVKKYFDHYQSTKV